MTDQISFWRGNTLPDTPVDGRMLVVVDPNDNTKGNLYTDYGNNHIDLTQRIRIFNTRLNDTNLITTWHRENVSETGNLSQSGVTGEGLNLPAGNYAFVCYVRNSVAADISTTWALASNPLGTMIADNTGNSVTYFKTTTATAQFSGAITTGSVGSGTIIDVKIYRLTENVTPVPPYDLDDLWLQGATGGIYYCTTARTATEDFSSTDWTPAAGYSYNGGTVTSIATGTGLTGGPITASGTISHLTTSGYKHIPTGGSSGQLLGYSADGTAVWVNKPSYTYSEVGADQAGAANTVQTNLDTHIDDTTVHITAAERASWNAKPSTDTNTTYSLSKSNDSITLTPSTGTAQTIVLPGIYYGTCTGTATAQTVTLDGVTAYYDGLTIALTFNVATQRRATININNLGAVPLRFILDAANSTSAATTYAPAGSMQLFVYDATNELFRSIYDYNSDTTDRIRHYYFQPTAGTYGINDYQLIMEDSTGKWQGFCTTTSTGTSKTVNPSGFRIDSGIFYYASTTNVENNGQVAVGVVYDTYGDRIDYRYSFNCGTTLIANLPIYLVGTINNDGYFYLDRTTSTSCYTQTLPTTEDGKLYIRLGYITDTYRGTLEGRHPIYCYRNRAVRLWNDVYSSMPTGSGYYVATSTGWRSIVNAQNVSY